MPTLTAPARQTSAGKFRERLRAALLAYCQEHYHAAPAEVQVPTLDLALSWLRADPELNDEMPSREAFLTQFELAFKKELAALEKYVAEQEATEATAKLLAVQLAAIRESSTLELLLDTAKEAGFALYQRSTGQQVKLAATHPSTRYAGEDWVAMQGEGSGLNLSTCQCRLLGEHYEFRPF
jgi:hypothetical protein